jgi:hypothetical protein
MAQRAARAAISLGCRCRAGSDMKTACAETATSQCSWRMHTTRTDESGAEVREYDGTSCDLKLCDRHTRMVGAKALCEWHHRKALEQGLVKT